MSKYEPMSSEYDEENVPLAKRKKKIKKEHSSAEDHSSFVASVSSEANDQLETKVIFSRLILSNQNILNIFTIILVFTAEVGRILLEMSQRMCTRRGALL